MSAKLTKVVVGSKRFSIKSAVGSKKRQRSINAIGVDFEGARSGKHITVPYFPSQPHGVAPLRQCVSYWAEVKEGPYRICAMLHDIMGWK